MLPCSRATTSASSLHSLGTRNRFASLRSSRALRSSWPMCLGRISAGVVPLPRSCVRQAKRTASGACSRALMSSTIIRWTPVSTSGWYSARCGTPHSRSTSGSSRCSAPHSRSSSNMRDGAGSISPRASSCQTRSGTSWSASPSCTMSRISCRVSAARLKSAKRAAKRATRRIRTGSSRNASVTWRSTRCDRSRRPWNGSITTPASSCAMALIVRSRRARSSSSVTPGSAWIAKPR